MEKTKRKEIRLKFFSISVAITLTGLVLFAAIMFIHKKELIILPEELHILLMRLSVVIGTLFTISLLLRVTLRRVYRVFDEPEESIFYSKIYAWLLYGTGVFVILGYLGVSLGNITLIIGLMATGLAFAVRDVLMSFFGWMVLLRKKPFRIGDYIQIGEDEGRVQHIGTFFVLLATSPKADAEYTRVPNRLFLEKSITKRGKETITDRIIIPMKGIPIDKEKRIEELRNELASLITPPESLRFYFDIRNDKLCFVVEFPTHINQQVQNRSDLTELLFTYLGDFIVVPQS